MPETMDYSLQDLLKETQRFTLAEGLDLSLACARENGWTPFQFIFPPRIFQICVQAMKRQVFSYHDYPVFSGKVDEIILVCKEDCTVRFRVDEIAPIDSAGDRRAQEET